MIRLKIIYIFYAVMFILAFNIGLFYFTVGKSDEVKSESVYSFASKNSLINYRLKEEVKELTTTTTGVDGSAGINGTSISNSNVDASAKPYWEFIKTYSTNTDIDPLWVCAMISQESAWEEGQVTADAVGLMQIQLATYNNFNDIDPGTDSRKKPANNINAGTRCFRDSLDSAKRYAANDEKSVGPTGKQYYTGSLIYGAGLGGYQKGNTSEAEKGYASELKMYKAYVSGAVPIGKNLN